jgi:hypothetical protein
MLNSDIPDRLYRRIRINGAQRGEDQRRSFLPQAFSKDETLLDIHAVQLL